MSGAGDDVPTELSLLTEIPPMEQASRPVQQVTAQPEEEVKGSDAEEPDLDQFLYEDEAEYYSRDEYDEADHPQEATPQREFQVLDRQVWDYPLTGREKRERWMQLMDNTQYSLQLQRQQENESSKERVNTAVRRQQVAEAELEQKSVQAKLEREKAEEMGRAAAVLREVVEKLIGDRPDMSEDVLEAYEKLRSLRLPGDAQESQAGGSSSSTDPVRGEEEASQQQQQQSLVHLAMELQKTLQNATPTNSDTNSEADRSTIAATPRTSDVTPRTSDATPRTSDATERTSDANSRVSDVRPRRSRRRPDPEIEDPVHPEDAPWGSGLKAALADLGTGVFGGLGRPALPDLRLPADFSVFISTPSS